MKHSPAKKVRFILLQKTRKRNRIQEWIAAIGIGVGPIQPLRLSYGFDSRFCKVLKLSQ
jgi:hypothetical protein